MPYADPLDERARAARRKHYINNKQQYKARNDKARQQAAEIIRAAKNIPCMDCEVKYPPYVMDFDHRDPSQKLGTANDMARYGLNKLRAEIAKCDVVCSNCHRERTWGISSAR